MNIESESFKKHAEFAPDAEGAFTPEERERMDAWADLLEQEPTESTLKRLADLP